jgi:ATP-dependent DNA helicase RecQ
MGKHSILAELDLVPSQVPALPAKVRDELIGYLLRWQYDDDARRCLQQLLATDARRVTVYDNLARAYIGLGEPARALEILARRHALRVSNSSRVLEARVHLAAGARDQAQAIATSILAESPDLVTGHRLQADLLRAAGRWPEAEAALHQAEELRPNLPTTALDLARLWEAQGDSEKALLWARTALARSQSAGHPASVELLRLLITLYTAVGQQAEAGAATEELHHREKEEREHLRSTLGLQPVEPPPVLPVVKAEPLTEAAPFRFDQVQVLSGVMDLSQAEREKLNQALRQHFPHRAFRPGQVEILARVLRGESVLAVMPTGAGKSLCYQLAALLLPQATLVVSPLIALMKDQLDGLPPQVQSQATVLHHALEGVELNSRLLQVGAGHFKLVYAAPERLRQRPFLHALKRSGVSLLVIDEAHCVSLWGHDFRPDYRFIAEAWRELGKPPILGMTATATPRVRDDIQAALGRMRLVATDLHRPNLFLEARHLANEAAKVRALLSLCQELEGCGIVYARSRNKCEELAGMLHRNGVNAIHYHALVQDRAATQDLFMNGQARVVVATIAFGMGVDKSDVRFILHYNPPNSLENYYQEAGRAGRDGLPARCILFHSTGDKIAQTHLARKEALELNFLRRVYAEVKQRLAGEGLGLVATADLERDLSSDETQIRVAIHFLEAAGLLWRGFNLPCAASLRLLKSPDGTDADFVRFAEAARLAPGQIVSRSLWALGRETALDVRSIEARVLAWADAGWLEYRGTGRDMLLALPTPPADSRQRMAAMLADYRSGQEGRIGEIMAYARTERCRHAYVGTYFGGGPAGPCQSCDNCLRPKGMQAPRPSPAEKGRTSVPRPTTKPEVTEPMRILILQAASELPFPLGCTGLARALKGSASSPVNAGRFRLFGALSGYTQESIREIIRQAESDGLLESFDSGHYRLLRLSAQGKAKLQQPGDRSLSVPPAPTPAQPEAPTDYDRKVYEQLKAWRLEVARSTGRAPFVVLHDAVLKRLAAELPGSLAQLEEIKGIGPRKLEQYGEALLGLLHPEARPGS